MFMLRHRWYKVCCLEWPQSAGVRCCVAVNKRIGEPCSVWGTGQHKSNPDVRLVVFALSVALTTILLSPKYVFLDLFTNVFFAIILISSTIW